MTSTDVTPHELAELAKCDDTADCPAGLHVHGCALDGPYPKKSPCTACGFPNVSSTGAAGFSAQWHREHKVFHLAKFPNLAERDPRSVRNFDESIVAAVERENGCGRVGRYITPDGKSIEVVGCSAHGTVASVPLDPDAPQRDTGYDAWQAHVLGVSA